MILLNEQIEAALSRSKRLKPGVLSRQPLDFIPDRKRTSDPIRLATRTGLLSGGGARPSEAELERLMGTNDLVDDFFLVRALLAAKPVCRISIRSEGGRERGCATGFMVSPRLMLTNHHVFSNAEDAAPSIAEFNYCLDVAGNPEPSYRFRLRPDLYFHNNEALDYALVSVEPIAEGDIPLSAFGYHRLIAQSGKALLKEWMNIIQHPGGSRRQYAMRENQCVEDSDPDVIWYMSDTAQGSSGSPVFNDSFQIVALHNMGVAKKDKDGRYILRSGKRVKDLRNIDDSEVDWIANSGIRISRICASLGSAPERNGHLAELRQAMQGGDVLSNAFKNPKASQPMEMTEMNPIRTAGSQPGVNRIVLGTLVLELNPGSPLVQGTALQPPTPPPAALDLGGGAAEAMKEPWIAPGLESRQGFDSEFLGISTPLPTVTNEALIAPLKSGDTILNYEHFSIVMHKTRRLAIFTASNVDGRAKSKRPEPGHDYTRKGLTGLGVNDMEKWVNDPRLDDAYQLPDKFYTKDNGAFDKGHIVRREDVCFGEDYDQVRRGNGDTFHVTNCSPQRGNFNQSGKGGIWGKLENFIGSQADKEVYCLFAGPILAEDDGSFSGVDDKGAVKVKIPSRFWKVVCAIKDGELQVFPFILEQDVEDLPLEFQINAEWKQELVSLKALEKAVKLVKFPKLYHDADQGK